MTGILSLVHERVSEEEIARIISRWTGIPVAKLTESETEQDTASGRGTAQEGNRTG